MSDTEIFKTPNKQDKERSKGYKQGKDKGRDKEKEKKEKKWKDAKRMEKCGRSSSLLLPRILYQNINILAVTKLRARKFGEENVKIFR